MLTGVCVTLYPAFLQDAKSYSPYDGVFLNGYYFPAFFCCGNDKTSLSGLMRMDVDHFCINAVCLEVILLGLERLGHT